VLKLHKFPPTKRGDIVNTGNEPWFDSGYLKLRTVRFVNGGLVVQFDNGDTVGVSVSDLNLPRHPDLGWNKAYLNEDGSVIIPGNPNFEIPGLTFRMLTDDAFAKHMQEQAVLQRKIVGARIRRMRERKNLTAEEVAVGADISLSELEKIENGESNLADNIGLLMLILNYMGYAPADLVKEQ